MAWKKMYVNRKEVNQLLFICIYNFIRCPNLGQHFGIFFHWVKEGGGGFVVKARKPTMPKVQMQDQRCPDMAKEHTVKQSMNLYKISPTD